MPIDGVACHKVVRVERRASGKKLDLRPVRREVSQLKASVWLQLPEGGVGKVLEADDWGGGVGQGASAGLLECFYGLEIEGGVVQSSGGGGEINAVGGPEEGLVLEVLAYAREVFEDGNGMAF